MEQIISEDVCIERSLNRESGVELLKIFAILLVIISHVVQTLTSWSQPWTVDIYTGIVDPTSFIIALLRYAGSLGNIIFFTCSAWYLLDKNTTNYKKVMRMIFDIFFISILWLIPILIWKGDDLPKSDIIRSLFPTYYNNNWYMTSYILFCFIYPVLNLVIKHLNQQRHLIIAMVLFFIYFGISLVKPFPWLTTFTLWATIYFIISYFRLYGSKMCERKGLNFMILIVAIVLHIFLVFISNYTYLKFGMLGAMKWNENNNPLFLAVSFTSLNLMRTTKFKSRIVNYVSSQSMFIYIIHENVLFRTYIRPIIWEWIYYTFGYDFILLWIFLFVVSLFIISFIIAVLYSVSLARLVHKVSDKMLRLISLVIHKIAELFIKCTSI